MKQLKLYNVSQESDYRYTGFTSFAELAEVVKDYPFDDEVLEKASIHNIHMQRQAGDNCMVSPFSVTLRMDTDSTVKTEDDQAVFCFKHYDIRDGRSKAAALLQLTPACLEKNTVQIHIFILSADKMDLL